MVTMLPTTASASVSLTGGLAWPQGDPRRPGSLGYDETDAKNEVPHFGMCSHRTGGRDAFRKYPHETEKHDPNRMRYMMGQEFRTRALNTSLRNAREDKYQADVNQMKQLERMCILAMEKQADGSKFRLGRLPAKEYWDFSGTLLRRNHMATWKWTSNFFVLDNGLLYEFEDNMLTSKIVSVWPILGATFFRSRQGSSCAEYPVRGTRATRSGKPRCAALLLARLYLRTVQ